MSWNTYYRGTGGPRDVTLPEPPPWRTFPRAADPRTFQPPDGLTDAVNAAVYLHRPLLITGAAGSGKSTVIEQVAEELRLGPVLRWHITSRSTLQDALCRYDALGHIHALRIAQSRAAVPPPPPGPATGSGARTVRSARELQGAAREPEAIREPGEVRETREVREPGEVRATRATEEIRPEVWAEGGGPGAGPAERPGSRPPARPETGWPGADDIAPFLQFGPLGTALLPGRERPRALLIDEIDKSDLDLPSDLLDVLERGEFKVPELVRHSRRRVGVRRWPGDGESDLPERLMRHPVENGHVRCDRFPFIVMTSNGEREFPAPFLRRCIRYDMPPLTPDLLRRAVEAHLGQPVTGDGRELIEEFVRRVAKGEALAVDQLLNAVRIVTDERGPRGEQRARLLAILLRELSGA